MGCSKYFDDPDLRGNLQEFFENKFVFIGDVSTGIADAGQTPLDRYAPLVIMHAALMNALLTNSVLSPVVFLGGGGSGWRDWHPGWPRCHAPGFDGALCDGRAHLCSVCLCSRG